MRSTSLFLTTSSDKELLPKIRASPAWAVLTAEMLSFPLISHVFFQRHMGKHKSFQRPLCLIPEDDLFVFFKSLLPEFLSAGIITIYSEISSSSGPVLYIARYLVPLGTKFQ